MLSSQEEKVGMLNVLDGFKEKRFEQGLENTVDLETRGRREGHPIKYGCL